MASAYDKPSSQKKDLKWIDGKRMVDIQTVSIAIAERWKNVRFFAAFARFFLGIRLDGEKHLTGVGI